MENAKQLESVETPLFKSKSFVLLWVATVVSSLSMSMFMFIQSWYVVEGLGLEAALGIVLICLTTSRMISMVAGGVLADRNRQTKMMFLSDFSRGVLAIVLALLFFMTEVPVWVLAINAAFFGIFGGLFEPARDSLLPKVVHKDQLTRANSTIQGAIQVALFSGPLLAGVLLSFVGYSILFLIISFCLFVAGVGVLFVKKREEEEREAAQTAFKDQLKEGFQYTWNSPLIKALFIITIIVNFFISGPLMMGLPIFVEGILNGSSIDFSFVQGGLTLGMIVGSIIIGIINLKKKRGAYALYLIGLQGIGMIVFSQSQSVWMAVLIILFVGMINPAVNIPLISMIQSYSDEDKVGRVMSLIRTGSLGLIPLSYAVTSFILSFGVSIDVIMIVAAVPLMVSVAVLYVAFPVLRTADLKKEPPEFNPLTVLSHYSCFK
ncbi:MFS transporter [Halobacillus litoralis]|uniref:MFS transporter n=1 Tax=Halobacillus litoralis TaxID=45668 RepID=UPI001CD607F9|nr:MFS transporter [Halobacillus litoralis]MCA0972469.1 MFS transporter [Halobacillus litoralis]